MRSVVGQTDVERRLRLFLLLLAASVYPMTLAELWFEDHTQEPLQFVPFVICGLGLIAIAAVLLRPTVTTLWSLRMVMLATIAGSMLGVFEHFQGDISFQRDIRPNASYTELLSHAIHGAAPILAPGILAFAAFLALASTYAHPLLARDTATAPALALTRDESLPPA